MKKFFVYAALLATTAVACDPLADINEQLDAQDQEFQLVKNDIEVNFDEDAYGYFDGVSFFSSTVKAEDSIPKYLMSEYPTLDKGSLISVTYDYLEENPSYQNAVLFKMDYTLTADDYESVGNGQYDNFDDEAEVDGDIKTILAANFDRVPAGDVIDVTYKFYNGGVQTRYAKYVSLGNGSYEAFNPAENAVAYELTNEDYASVDRGTYNNFNGDKEYATLIPVILDNNFGDAAEGDVKDVTYKYYVGSVETGTALFEFKGGSWGLLVTEFGQLLTAEDYDMMGAPGQYNNFSGSVPAEDYLPGFLNNQYRNSDEFIAKGFTVYIKYYFYAGGGKSEYRVAELIYSGTEFAMTPKTFKQTSYFAFDGDKWAIVQPYTFTAADYESTGDGRYDNFGYYDNEAGEFKGEAVDNVLEAKIKYVMNAQFSDAADGTLFMVYYKYYNQGSTTEVSKMMEKTAEGWVFVEL